MDYDYDWKSYVPVAARRRQATRELAKLAKKGHPASLCQREDGAA